MKYLLIIAAGNGTRMGQTSVPKALYPINGKPNIEWLIDSAKDFHDKIYIVSRVGFGSQFEYLKDKFSTPLEVIEIVSGLGDGHAVLNSISKIFDKCSLLELTQSILSIVWGDLYCPTFEIFKELTVYNKMFELDFHNIVVPLAIEDNPYVHFSIDQYNDIKAANFSKFGETVSRGLHDQSIFIGSAYVFHYALTQLHNTLWKDGKYVSNSGELNLLHIFHYLYNIGKPAKVHLTELILSSYNSINEANNINNG